MDHVAARRGRVAAIAIAIVCGVAVSAASYAGPAPGRRIVVISDLHLGAGRLPDGQWDPYEDFRWQDDIRPFFEWLRSKPTDLVLNGDTFELWQSRTVACVHDDLDAGCSEAEARVRLAKVLAAHRDVLDLLRRFADRNGNRLFIVPGNHDAALLFAGVAADVVRAVGARPGRVTVVSSGFWRSERGDVVVFHGHQMDDANAFAGWPQPFIEHRDVRYLRRPVGERIVQSFVNEAESRYEVVDNIGSDVAAFGHAVAADGLRGLAPHDVGVVVKLLQSGISRNQLADILGRRSAAPREDAWDVAAERQKGARFFADSVPRRSAGYDAMRAAVASGDLDAAFRELSDADLIAICMNRSALAAAGEDIAECAPATLGRGMQEVHDDLPGRIHNTLASIGAVAARIVVVGHTHAASRMTLADRDDGHRIVLLNDGAWQRTMSDAEFEQFQKTRHISATTALGRLRLRDLPPCYSYVVIDAGADPKLLRWTEDRGKWRGRDSCNR